MGIFHPLLLKFADHSRDEINGQLRVSVCHGQLKLGVGFVFFIKILLSIRFDTVNGGRGLKTIALQEGVITVKASLCALE